MSFSLRLGRQSFFWLFLFTFYFLWTAAWLLRVGPMEKGFSPWFGDPNHDTLYWTLCKFLIWILMPAAYLRWTYGVGLWEYLGLSRWAKRGWAWGLGCSAVMAVLYLAYDLLAHVPLSSPGVFTAGPFLGAVLVAPVVEEIFFRGFMVRQLQGWWKSFGWINLAASLAWVLAHWVGWYFQGRVSFPDSLGFSLHLAILGLIFGYLNRFSGSLWTSLILHVANNLYSDHFWNYFHSTRAFA